MELLRISIIPVKHCMGIDLYRGTAYDTLLNINSTENENRNETVEATRAHQVLPLSFLFSFSL